ncbi:MAG: chromophore lyase CpcT/CpeT [Elainellaceae cyanobacterium]
MVSHAAFQISLIGLGHGLLAFAPPQAIAQPSPVEAVTEHLVGVMDTAEQSRQDPAQPAVQMTTCPIAVDSAAQPSSTFLYQEQALLASTDEPYRQRILLVAPIPHPDLPASRVQSISYRPTDAAALVGLCNEPAAERSLAAHQLGEVTCRVFIAPAASGFLGTTLAEGCPTQVRGAVRVTNEILLHGEGMDTWDRGFDAEGQQVWGATDEPYRFRWRSPTGAEAQGEPAPSRMVSP